MKIKTTALLIAAAMLQSLAASAQTTTQELYTVKFRATCKPGDNADGRAHKMNERDLIEQVVGMGLSQKDLKRNYALVYNPATDSIQVVSQADGAALGDVFIFQGGTNTVVGDQLTRFAFVFAPNQSDAIGSAVITERANNNNDRARINGKIQFTMPSTLTNTTTSETASISSTDTSNNNGDTNTVSNTSTNVDGSPLTPTGDTNNVTGDNSNNGNNNSNNDTGRDGNGGTVGSENFVQASAAAASTTDVEVCSGTFTAGKLFRPGTNNNDNNGDNNNGGTGDTNTTGTISGVGNSSTNSASTNALDANSIDARFLTQAAQSDLLEIQLATLAAQTSTNQDVINYATGLIQDHTQTSAQLQQLAAAKGITLPTTLSTANQSIYNNLSRLQGLQFDRNFLNRAVSTHQSAIQLYNNEASRGEDADVKAFATATLPTLQQHLTEAQTLRTQL